MSEIKDFSKKRNRILFRIDDDVFEATPAVPADTMISFAKRFTVSDPTQMTVEQQLNVFTDVLGDVLLPESMDRMRARMGDKANPVDLDQLDSIIQWLFEEYGMRPTPAPSDSSNGDADRAPGTTSTESTPQMVSISAASPSTDS